MNIYSAALTLILVMDPLGNIPVFISVLNRVAPEKRARVILRESLFAFIILSIFLYGGRYILHGLNITEPALGMAGGIILFLIAIRMIFPPLEHPLRDKDLDEPFIVPLAIPLLAGPSSLATVLLLATQFPHKINQWFIAVFIASTLTLILLLFADLLRKYLGRKGLIAIERLMGMILTTISVQMFLNGVHDYIKTLH